MFIRSNSRTIELTKKEMAAASRFGTQAYKDLQTARRDNPGFVVTTISHKVKTQRETYKGLTYAYMEKYIKTHDDEAQSIMAEYKMYRGMSDDPATELPDSYTYNEMKIWFLGKFEEIAKFYENRS